MYAIFFGCRHWDKFFFYLRKVLYSVLEQYIRCFEPTDSNSVSSPFQSSRVDQLPHLFSPFEWLILIRLWSKALKKIVAYNIGRATNF